MASAACFASAANDQFPRSRDEQYMRAEKRLGKADATWVGVEKVQVRLEKFLGVRPQGLFRAYGNQRAVVVGGCRRAFADRGAQIAAVAHQQQRSHRFQSVQQTEHPALPLTDREG